MVSMFHLRNVEILVALACALFLFYRRQQTRAPKQAHHNTPVAWEEVALRGGNVVFLIRSRGHQFRERPVQRLPLQESIQPLPVQYLEREG